MQAKNGSQESASTGGNYAESVNSLAWVPAPRQLLRIPFRQHPSPRSRSAISRSDEDRAAIHPPARAAGSAGQTWLLGNPTRQP
jgi:hypothetical protein